MRNLLWKEWREHRMIFFLILAIAVITRIFLSLFFLTSTGREEFGIIGEDIITVIHGLLSIIFTLILGAAPFTNEFSNGTHTFLLCQPITKARIFWTKFFSGLILLTLLILFTSFVLPASLPNHLLNVNFGTYTKTFPFIIFVIYSTTFLTSLLLRDAVATVIATPFVITAGLLLILIPFLPLVVLEPMQLFKNHIPVMLGYLSSFLFILFILMGFLCWQKAIAKSKSPYRIVALIVSTVITIQVIVIIGFLLIFLIWLIIWGDLHQFLEQTTIILCLVPSLVFIILGFLFWRKIVSSIRYPAKMLTCVLISVIFLFLVTYTIANFITGRELKGAIISAKKAGLPLTIKEIIPPPVPDNENAAILYEECFLIYEKLKKKYSKEWEDMHFERKFDIKGLSLDQKKRLTGIFNDPDFVGMYDLLKKAGNMPSCRFNLKYEKGFLMELPHLGKLRVIIKMLTVKILLLMEENKYNEALGFAMVSFNIGEALKDEPIYISQIYRLSYNYIVMEGLRDAISNMPPDAVPADACRRLITVIGLKKDNAGLRKGLEGDTAFNVDIFGKIIHGEVRLNEIFAADFPGGDLLAKIFWRFYTSYLGKPLMKKDSAFYLNSTLKILGISFSPYYEIKDKIVKFEKEFGDASLRISSVQWKHPVSSKFLPWLISKQKEWAENTAKLDDFKIALALKIYKAEKGEYPNSLNILTPGYLPELPKDPFTGRDYIYRREADGFIVYSIGKNEKDEGGVYNKEKLPGFDDCAWQSSK